MSIPHFPVIKTPKITLRQIEESDSDVIFFLRTDKSVTKFIERPENRKTKNIQDAVNHINRINTDMENNKSVSWGIMLNDDPSIIGTICLWNFSEDKKNAEVGYDLKPDFQKQGIMSEALKNVLNFGFNELKLHKIEAYTHYQNKSSIRLLEKNGFSLIKSKKDKDNQSNIVFAIKNTAG